MKVYSDKGIEYEALKLPYSRMTGCKAYETDGKCEYYAYGYISGGCWEGSICLHPEAKGNKTSWLTICPIKEVKDFATVAKCLEVNNGKAC